MRKTNSKQIQKSFNDNQITGLSPLELIAYKKVLKKLEGGQDLTFINIICPGYKKKREIGVEEFDFVKLSENVLECPNVILMLSKMNDFLKSLDNKYQGRFRLKTILADVAILNHKELIKKQNIKKVMQNFLLSIKNSNLIKKDADLINMSELPHEFKQIPLGGIKPALAKSLFIRVETDIKDKAKEYIGSLMFDRMNKIRSEGKSIKEKDLVVQATKEVERFVAEYGLAGLAIKKMYKNPIVFFTEPSGYMRGYFYNSFLNKKDRLPVLYLC